MKVFIDTEFTGLNKDSDLISVGLVDELGNTFYGELTDYDDSKLTEGSKKWLRENVYVSLKYNKVPFYPSKITEENGLFYYSICNTREKVGSELLVWLKKVNNIRNNKLEFIIDVGHYDMVFLLDLLLKGIYGENNTNTVLDLPEFIPTSYHDFNSDLACEYDITERDAFDLSREDLVDVLNSTNNNEYIELHLLGNTEKHNSLYDALVCRAIYDMIGLM